MRLLLIVFGRNIVRVSVVSRFECLAIGVGGLRMKPIDARRLTSAQRQRILQRDNGLCVYCTEDADEVDHVIPWSFKHDDRDENLVAACWLCNQIASNKLFDTIQEKKNHILRRKRNILKNTIIPIWTEDELRQMGKNMKLKIRSNCIIAETDEDASYIAAKLASVGLEVRLGS